VVLILLNFTYRSQNVIDYGRADWDLKRVNSSDYTVEVKLSEEQIQVWKLAGAGNDSSIGMILKKSLISEIELVLNKNNEDQNLKVADVNITFKNA